MEGTPQDVASHPLELPPAELEALEPGVVVQWRLQALWRAALVLVGLLFAILPAAGLGAGAGAIGSVAVAVILLGVAFVVWHPRARHRRFRFAVDDRFLYVRDGVLVHREKVIPVSRMQHVDIQRGPLERLLGLASLSVHTAGGAAATFRLPGLAPSRGEELRSRILAAKE